MALLTQQEVQKIAKAMIEGGIDVGSTRNSILFQFIDPMYKSSLPSGLSPLQQLVSDLGQLSDVERLANGDIPLQTYLANAIFPLTGRPQENIIRSILDDVQYRLSGAPRIDLVKVPETKELIIHTDDTVAHIFMAAGVAAARSVAKLVVPAFENGIPRMLPRGQMIGNGTGWLITPSLIITNQHVVNARKEGEPDATGADLQLQAKNITAIFDYDAEGEGTEIKAVSLEAFDKTLDYAILRLPDTGRKPLRFAASKIASTKDPIPVNIIQHPNGKAKRFGIRNNLVSASTDTDLRYFTDTEGGSSGSPVLNDKWETVALHRAATYVENVQFQGKSTAYVNMGTHLISIFDDLRNRFPALGVEINI